MGIRTGLIKALGGDVLNATPPAPIEQQPTPYGWLGATFAPGAPVRPVVQELDKPYPREWDYVIARNTMITPRSDGFGLRQFPELLEAYENITELKMAIHVMMRELGLFQPRIVNADGDDEGPGGQFYWFTQKPDGELPWDIWLNRFLKGRLIYDAACAYMDLREEKLRYVDGSTIFPFIDQHGHVPAAPWAAYAQVIKGQPFMWFTRDELWYKPADRRINAPYGTAPSEMVWADLMILANIKGFELAYYREGNTPEGIIFPKEGSFSAEQMNTWEQAFNSRMSAGAAERRRLRVAPFSGTFQVVKKGDFPQQLYEMCCTNVYGAIGLSKSELGQVPGRGLGGKGFADMSESSQFRSGLNPLRVYVESACNDFLSAIGAGEHTFQLAFPTEEENAKDLTTMVADQVANMLLTVNEGRAKLGMDPTPGGDVFVMIRGGQVMLVSNLNVVPDQPGENTSDATAAANSSIDAQPTTTSQDKALALRVLQSGSVSPTKSTSTTSGTTHQTSDDLSKAELLGTPRGRRADVIRKLTGVSASDDEYYLAPVAAAGTVDIPMDHHANEVTIVALVPDDLPPQPAVFKPFSGENPKLIARIGGPQYLREEAAYILDRALVLYLVPVAYNARIDGSPGAVVFWAKDAQPSADVNTYSRYWLERAAVLDYVSGQGDRHTGNWLTHPVDPGRPIIIDNGLSFPTKNLPIYSPFVQAVANQPLGKELVGMCKIASHDAALWANLHALVGEEAVDLAKARLLSIVDSGMLVIESEEEAEETGGTSLSETPIGQDA